MTPRALFSTLLLSVAAFRPALAAQEEPPRSGVFIRVGGGGGYAISHDTDDNSENVATPLAALHLGTGGRRVQGVLEVQWQPVKLSVPPGDRALSQLYFLASLQWFVQRQLYFRGGIGGVHQTWSRGGGDASAAALGFTVGFEARTFGRWLAFEALWRGTYSLCFEECGFAGTRLWGAQVLVPFY